MTKPTLVIMAAGIGSRYGGLKQIDPVGPSGELIIDYSVYDALQAGFDRVVFVIKPDIEIPFRERIGDKIAQHCDIAYVYQQIDKVPAGISIPPHRTKPWGTAHATLMCQPAVDTPFAVINADDFYGRESFALLAEYLSKPAAPKRAYDFCMVGYALENTLTDYGHVARGVCTVDADHNLVTVTERTHIERVSGAVKYTEDGVSWVDIPAGSTVSMNMWGFTPELFDEIAARFPQFIAQNQHCLEKAEYFLPAVVNDLLHEEKATVKVLPTTEQWVGVTYQQDKPRVQQHIANLIQQGQYPKQLWNSSK